jgi:hypothetical protein
LIQNVGYSAEGRHLGGCDSLGRQRHSQYVSEWELIVNYRDGPGVLVIAELATRAPVVLPAGGVTQPPGCGAVVSHTVPQVPVPDAVIIEWSASTVADKRSPGHFTAPSSPCGPVTD